MAAPSAPSLKVRTTVGAAYLRWKSVSGAATYKVYDGAALVATVNDDASGWNQYAYALVGPGSSLTVTAVNAGAEESAASNAITVQNLGTANRLSPRSPFG